MSSPLSLGRVGNCGCCDADCGSVAYQAIGCKGTPYLGAELRLESGGALSGLASKVFGSGYTRQPTASVAGDGCGAQVAVVWSPPTGGGGSPSTTGPQAVTAGANRTGLGTVAWSNPGRITTDDNSHSSAFLDTGVVSNYLEGSKTFSIAANQDVTRVKVRIEVVSGEANALDYDVRLVVGGSVVGSNKALGTIISLVPGTVRTYDFSIAEWGLSSLTSADVNAGIGFVFSAIGDVGGDNVIADYAEIDLTYQPAASGGITDYTLVSPGVGYTTATITIHRGAGDTTGAGASVAASGYSSIVEEHSCTANRFVRALRIDATGSGYTNGAGYALGFSGGSPATPAAGTFNVSSGGVTVATLTNHGAGYAPGSTPTVTTPGAGSGTGAIVTPLMFDGCLHTYGTNQVLAVRYEHERVQDVCVVVPVKCPADYVVAPVLTPKSAYACSSLCQLPLLKTLHVSLTGTGISASGTIAWQPAIGAWPDGVRLIGAGWQGDLTVTNCGFAAADWLCRVYLMASPQNSGQFQFLVAYRSPLGTLAAGAWGPAAAVACPDAGDAFEATFTMTFASALRCPLTSATATE